MGYFMLVLFGSLWLAMLAIKFIVGSDKGKKLTNPTGLMIEIEEVKQPKQEHHEELHLVRNPLTGEWVHPDVIIEQGRSNLEQWKS